jgi:hypothetical protein
MQLVKCFVSLADGNFAELPKLLKLFLPRSSQQRCLPYRIGEGDLFRAHILGESSHNDVRDVFASSDLSGDPASKKG